MTINYRTIQRHPPRASESIVKVLCDVTASVAPIPDSVERAPGDIVSIFVIVEVASDTMVDGLRAAVVVELIREVTETLLL